MAFVQAKCPECGGMLAVDADKKAAVCQFCGEAFIVQEAVNNYNTYNITNNNYDTTHQYGDGSVVNVYEFKRKDFVIEAGVLKEYHGESVDVVIPDNVNEIGEKAFSRMMIKSVLLPRNLKKINFQAFSGCSELTEIALPNSLTEIGCGAFSGCTGLNHILIPGSITKIKDSAFSRCTGIKSITIPESVKEIESFAFFGCTGIKSITIPESVMKIGIRAFDECIGLTSVNVSKNTHIGDKAFSDYWKSKGLCSHCGRNFKFFSNRCKQCGNPKDY